MDDSASLFAGVGGTICLVPLLLFVVTIWLWRSIGMWFSGMRELIREVRGLRQDIQQLRGYSSTGVVSQPPALPSSPTAPTLARPAAPATYTPPAQTYNPRQMSSTPPPGWTGPWDPSQFGKQ